MAKTKTIARLEGWLAQHPWLLRWGAVVLVCLVAGSLRLYAAYQFRVAYDEDDYLVSSRQYRELIDRGEFRKIGQVKQNFEHPPLVKVFYGLTLVENELEQIPTKEPRRGSRQPLPRWSLRYSRWQSVAFGTLTVGLLSLADPLAGLLVAVCSLHLVFTSLAYLDALPTFLTALAVYLFYGKTRRSFWLSAMCFGAGVACKYPYALIGIALLAHSLVHRRHPIRSLMGWGVVSVVAFLALNPYLWPDPISRVEEQLSYHAEYAQKGRFDSDSSKPIQQMVDPQGSMRYLVKRVDGFQLLRTMDLLISPLAFVGLFVLLRRRDVYGWWLVTGFAFLMLWPTHWIQHNMMIVVPYCVSAAVAARWVMSLIRKLILSQETRSCQRKHWLNVARGDTS